MNTPLLVSDEPNVVPSLSGGGSIDPDANSQLTLMLRESSSPPSNATLLLNNDIAISVRASLRRVPLTTVSFVTILSGSLIIIQIGLLWGSFLSSSWLQIHLVATQISWLTPTLDTMLKNLDLGEMMNVFCQTQDKASVAILAMTTILVPCLAMIAQPLTILERHSAVLLNQTYEAKSMVNYWIRFGFLVTFCVIVFDLCSSYVQINWEDSQVMVQNRVGPGLLAYTIGLTIAVSVAMMLRLSHVKEEALVVSVGPAVEEFEQGYMRVLEEEAEATSTSPEEEDPTEDEIMLHLESTPARCCSYRLLIFEAAVLSISFGIVSFFLPLFHVSYEGVAAAFLPQTQLDVTLLDLVQVERDSPGWIAFFLQAIIVLQVICFPFLTVVVASITAFGTSSKRWLAAVHPGANGSTLCAAILIIVPALESLGNYVLKEQTSGLCNGAADDTDDSCLTMIGSIGIGTWCFLAHVVCLEVFVLLISWRS
jgi:hypothetical protein